jgi:hypothetical protein
MTEQEFYKEVIDEITASCTLPLFTRTDEIKRITKKAIKWFYRNYEFALEEAYLVIPQTTLETSDFKTTRTLKLDDDIESVFTVYEPNGLHSLTPNKDPDLNLERRVLEGTYRAGAGGDLVYYVAAQSFISSFKSLFLQTFQFYFNYNTKNFKLQGNMPRNGLVLSIYRQIPPEKLYGDPLFLEYVIARTKMQIARVLSTFEYNLIGDARLNISEIQQEGKDEWEEVKEKIETSNNTDWFYMVH